MIDTKRFAKAVFEKRCTDSPGKERSPLSVRKVRSATGLSIATISRIEREEMPDLRSYGNLCNWLGVSLDTFWVKENEK